MENEELLRPENIDLLADDMIQAIGKAVMAQEQKPAVVNPAQVKKVAYIYDIVRYITRGSKCKVTYELHSPFSSMGCVSVEGKKIVISDFDWLQRAVECAANVDIYPKTNGNIRIDFTVHGLTKRA